MQDIIAKLTAKDDKYACAIADKIISESQDTDAWYEYFDAFASLLNHPKSLVRNRVLYILAANAQWDDENQFDAIISDYLVHVTDEKPITASQCIITHKYALAICDFRRCLHFESKHLYLLFFVALKNE